MPKTATKAAKTTAAKRKPRAKTATKAAIKRRVTKTTKTRKPRATKRATGMSEKSIQIKDKFLFLLGTLIIVTGGSIMVEILSLSVTERSANYASDFVLFPLALVFLLLGIGIVVSKTSRIKF